MNAVIILTTAVM
jgi:hypothetical protein